MVYSVVCECSIRYIGETAHNLKVRIHEHTLRSANSAIGQHVWAEKDRDATADHSVLEDSTVVIAHERNTRKRKFIESACIMSKAPRLCNLGPSMEVSDVWGPNLCHVARALPNLD